MGEYYVDLIVEILNYYSAYGFVLEDGEINGVVVSDYLSVDVYICIFYRSESKIKTNQRFPYFNLLQWISLNNTSLLLLGAFISLTI